MRLYKLLALGGVLAASAQTTLPIGDGKISPEPRVGYVFSCQQHFDPNAPGARATGSWVKSDNTFAPGEKPTVQGSVEWPTHAFSITTSGDARNIVGNDLPNHPTGNFPIARTDPASQYDRNPNHIAAQNVLYKLPANPTAAEKNSCVPMGAIGFLFTGVYLFNALDAAGRDAVAHEVQDTCHGHPGPNSAYHYHNLTQCLPDPGTGHSALVGYALDGFGIYGPRGEDGKPLHNADLDACHGHTHAIQWDGKTVVMYHYHATAEYPYVVGCFHGTPVVSQHSGPQGGTQHQGGPGRPGGRPGQPPPGL